MNTLLISFFLILFTSIGLGLLFHFLVREKQSVLLGEAGLWGLLIAGVLGNLLNFIIPISPIVSYILAFIGIGFCSYLIMKNKSYYKRVIQYLPLLFLFLIFIICFLYYAVITYDTPLYHLQTIKWNRLSAVPFGLANLHDRFGLNSLWFMTSSVLYFNYSSPFVINGVLFFLFCCFLLQQVIILLKNKSSRYLAFLPIGLLFILFYSNYYFSTTIFGNNLFTSPATDFASTIFFCYLMFVFILSFIHDEKYSFRFVLISGLLVMIKMTYLPAFIFFLFYFCWSKRNNLFNSLLKEKGFILLSISFVIWIVRSFILSGCLVYPVVQTCFPGLLWGETPGRVIEMSTVIRNWARSPGNLDPTFHTGFNWVSNWVRMVSHHPYIHYVLYLIIIFGVLGVVVHFLMYQNSKQSNVIKLQMFLIPLFVFSFAYWFILGPDIRFIQGYFIGVIYIISLPFLLYLGRYFQEINMTHFIYLLSVGLLLYFVLINRNELFWILKKGNQEKWPFMAQYELQYVNNPQGVKVYYPKNGDQCGDTELICSNLKKDKLNIYKFNNRLMFVEK